MKNTLKPRELTKPISAQQAALAQINILFHTNKHKQAHRL
uniref:Transposase n=1 Tax=Heterorhabditis bacteriophora TaxID=37862 RepID=A0A1I7WJG4_HETBA